MTTSPQEPQEPQPSIQDQLAAGDLKFVANMYSGPMPELDKPSTADVLDGMRNRYGAENVLTSNAFDRSTESATGMPNMFGIYVTSVAYEAAQQAYESPTE